MKFICESCSQLTESDGVRMDEGVVVLNCAVCGAETRLEERARAQGTADGSQHQPMPAQGATGAADRDGASPQPQVTEKPTSEPEESLLLPLKCPKCFHRQNPRDNCERCGLNLTRGDVDTHLWEPDPKGNEAEYARALELWSAIETTPADDDNHEAFLEHCTNHTLMDLCTRRYRERLSDHPGEEPTRSYLKKAVERLEKVAAAMLAGDAWAQDLQQKVRKVKAVLIVIAVALVILAMVILILVIKKKQEIVPIDL